MATIPTSVQTAIRYARENARTLRALISTEMWLQINVFHGRIRALTEADIAPESVSGVCAMLKEGVQSHTGITEGTFYRDQCWHFYMMGRHIERADQITRLIDTKFNALMPQGGGCRDRCRRMERSCCVPPPAIMRIAASIRMAIVPPEVAGFLLLNTAFPRSAGLSLAQLDWHLTTLRSRYHLRGCTPALARLDELQSMLAAQTVEEILRRGLSPFLDWMQRELGALHADIMTRLCGAPVLAEQEQEFRASLTASHCERSETIPFETLRYARNDTVQPCLLQTHPPRSPTRPRQVPQGGPMLHNPTGTGIGQPVRRREDLRLLTGRGRYSDDVNVRRPGLCGHGALAACACAHPFHRHRRSERRPRCARRA